MCALKDTTVTAWEWELQIGLLAMRLYLPMRSDWNGHCILHIDQGLDCGGCRVEQAVHL